MVWREISGIHCGAAILGSENTIFYSDQNQRNIFVREE